MPIISPKIPSGLEDLMRGLAKSCIKENPDNIYEFAAEYFENLLKQRDGVMDQGYKNFATYKVYKKNRSARSRRDKENVIDESTFRVGAAANGFGQELIKSGSAKEKYFASEDKSEIEEIFLPSSRPSTAEIGDTSISMDSEVNTTIVKETSIKHEGFNPTKSINLDDENVKNMVLDVDMERAALKIQSTFRGFKTRKEMKNDEGDDKEIDGGNVVNDEENVIVQKEETTLSAGLPSVELKADDAEQLENDVENVIEGSENMLKTNIQGDYILDTLTSSQEDVDSYVIPLMTEDNEQDSITKDIDINETAKIAENQSEVTDIECTDGNVMILNDEELKVTSEQVQTKTEHELVKGVEIIETCMEHKVFNNLKHSVEENLQNINENPKENYENSQEKCVEVIQQNTDDTKSEAIELEVTDKWEVSPITTKETRQETAKEEGEEVSTMSFDNKVNVAEIGNQEDVDAEIVNDIPDVTELILQSKSTEDQGAVKEVTLDEDNAEHNVERAVDMMANVSEETMEQLSVEKKTENLLELIEVPEENVLLDEKLSSKVVEDLAAGNIEKFLDTVEATGEVENVQKYMNENEAENIVIENVMNMYNNTMPEGTENTDENSSTVYLIAIKNIETLPENVIQSMDKIESTQTTTDASAHDFNKLTETEATEIVIQTEAINESSEVQNTCEDLLEIEAVDAADIEAYLELTQDGKSQDQNETLDNVESAMISNELMEKQSLLETEGSNVTTDKSQESSGELQEVVEIIEMKSVDNLEAVSVQSVDEADFKELFEKLKQISAEDEDIFAMNADEISAIVEMPIEQTTPEINEHDNEHDNISVDNVEVETVLSAHSETLSADGSVEKETECSIDIPPTEKSIDDSFVNSGEDIGAVAPSDDILEPEKEESEIPEESSTTIDENLTTDDVPFITNEENLTSIDVTNEIIPESQQENDVPKANEEEDVSDMILDDEMEGAALKIQAAFRGHQIRKENAPSKSTIDKENDNQSEENQGEQKTDNEIVIDNCSDEQLFSTEQNDTVNEETTVEVEENEETTTTQETKEDEAEEETQTEEETNDEEEKEVEEEAEEDEVEVETVENEGGSDEPDATGEPADQASGSTEQATNDDDDVANMVMDEDMEQAALKIQSTFRGHKTRKDMKNKEEEVEAVADTTDASEEKKDTVEDLNEDVGNMVLDEEMEQAALKIQSTFRGHKTRKDMKNKDGEDETEEKEVDETPVEEEKPEEPKPEEPMPEETKTEESTSTGKTAQQLQDEEDIANIVMDKDMEKAALRIQNTFRGKRFGAKKSTKDEDISYETGNSSSEKKHVEDASNESPIKILSEEEPFTNEDTIKLSKDQSNESVDQSVTEEDDTNFMATQQYSGSNNERYSIERFNDVSSQHQQQHSESFKIDNNIEMILMKSSEELIGEACCDISNGAAGEEKENDNENRNRIIKTTSIEDQDEKDIKDEEDEIEEPLAVEKIVKLLTSMEDEKLIENFDFDKNKNTAEAMYMQLKKNEMETQKQVTIDADENVKEDEEEEDDEDEEDDDVVVMVPTVTKDRKLRYGVSMDDRLLGLSRSILSDDYSPKLQSVDSGEEHSDYNPMMEASKQSSNFMNQLHSRSESDEGNDNIISYRKLSEDMGEEDQFDDFYPGNIRQKMMASSVSIADSDYYDPTKSEVINDDTVRTALETINSTDSDSTIASAATKIQAGARGLITRRKLNNNTSSSQQHVSHASFGNAAIDKSLDDFIVAQEQERLEETEGDLNSFNLKMHQCNDEYTDEVKKSDKVGVIGTKLGHKNLLTVDQRRRKLHREDAVQRNSTFSNTSSEKLIDNNNSTIETVVDIQSQQPLVTAEEPISIQEVLEPKEATKRKSVVTMKTSKIPKSMIPRQNTMPVQIDTNLIRILPKHLRKRIRSAESDKKKKSK